MNIDQFCDNCTAIADRIAGRTEMDNFLDFSLDMTESFYLKWNNAGRVERVAVMDRISGQKESERKLWSVGPVAPEKANEIEKREHAERLENLTAQYASDPNFEIEVDPYTFATGLAKAYREYTGEAPMFLLDENGEF